MFGDERIGNHGKLDEVDIQIHGRHFLDATDESFLCVFGFIMLPVHFLKICLKGSPIMSTIPREQFDEVFDGRGTIIGEAGTLLAVNKAVILTFNVPFFQKVSDVVAVKVHRSELTRARHHSMRAYVDKGGSRRVIVRS